MTPAFAEPVAAPCRPTLPFVLIQRPERPTAAPSSGLSRHSSVRLWAARGGRGGDEQAAGLREGALAGHVLAPPRFRRGDLVECVDVEADHVGGRVGDERRELFEQAARAIDAA